MTCPRAKGHNWKRWLGRCYEVAANYVLDNPEAVLCHGVVTGQGPSAGRRFGHAWVEIGDEVIDFTSPRVAWPRADYYAYGDITQGEVVRYTQKQAAHRLIEANHYGPWEEVTP